MATQLEVAQHIDLTTRRVRDLIAEGSLPKTSPSGWDLDECRLAYIQYLRARSVTGGGKGNLDALAERARKDSETADKLALENARTRGEIVSVHEVAGLWARLASESKARLLGVPTKAAPLVMGCKRVAQAQAIMEAQIHDALGAIADPGAGVPGGNGAAAEADREPVGGQLSEAEPGVKRRAGALDD